MATDFNCINCKVCLGSGCIGQLPGMGGVDNNKNFILNCSGWKKYHHLAADLNSLSIPELLAYLRLAPMTGAQENIGWPDEDSFYEPFIGAVFSAGIGLTIGDGFPDNKLLSGIKAVQVLPQIDGKNPESGVFLKPYSQDKIFERIEWSKPVASHYGIDIDAYNIVTMRNKVNLDKKTASQIKEIMAKIDKPFVVKGVFTKEDIELCKEAKPDVIFVSNHGGRINTDTGATADFLAQNVKELKNYCKEVWVDGGIRTLNDLKAAISLGADQVLIGRPLATAFCYGGQKGVADWVKKMVTV